MKRGALIIAVVVALLLLAAVGIGAFVWLGSKPVPAAAPARSAAAGAAEALPPSASDVADGVIRGDWDNEAAHAIAVHRLLNGKVCDVSARARADKIECHEHWLIRNAFMTLGDTRTKVVLYASAARRDRKAKLSVFEFRQEPDAWRLGRTELLFEEWSQCGGTKPNELKIVNFRNDGYFLFGFERCFDGEVRRETRIRALTRVRGKLVEVLRQTTGEAPADEGSDPAAPASVQWESAYAVDAAAVPDAEVPDILLELRDVRQGVAVHEVVRFRFNGERFARMASASQLAAARAAASATASSPSAPGP